MKFSNFKNLYRLYIITLLVFGMCIFLGTIVVLIPFFVQYKFYIIFFLFSLGISLLAIAFSIECFEFDGSGEIFSFKSFKIFRGKVNYNFCKRVEIPKEKLQNALIEKGFLVKTLKIFLKRQNESHGCIFISFKMYCVSSSSCIELLQSLKNENE